MNTNRANAGFSRRSFLVLLAATSLGLFGWITTRPKAIAKAAPFVKPKEYWTADHFFDFLRALPADAMLGLKKSLGLLRPDDNETKLKGNDQDARDIQKHVLWLSSNILAYPFRNPKTLYFHKLVTWVSSEAGVPESIIQRAPTIALERELLKFLFPQMWDKLTEKQRVDLLAKLDPNGTTKDKAGIAAMSGAGALAALSTTVAFAGFAFYTTMSVTIATVAGAAGVVFPIATYTTASSMVGVLSGPVGWAIMAVAALGGIALRGRPNLPETAALIGQIHALKIEALIAAGVPEQDVFNA